MEVQEYTTRKEEREREKAREREREREREKRCKEERKEARTKESEIGLIEECKRNCYRNLQYPFTKAASGPRENLLWGDFL